MKTATLLLALPGMGVTLLAFAQPAPPLPTPRPDTPFSTRPGPGEAPERAEKQYKAMQDVHQRLISAKTPQERWALVPQHKRAMQLGLAALEEWQRDASAHSDTVPGWQTQRQMQRQMEMLHLLLQMMMDRLDMLDDPTR